VAALAADVEPPSAAEADAVDTIRKQLAEAAALRQAGRYSDAGVAAERAQTLAENVEYGPIDTEIALAKARVMNALEQYDAAQEAYREAIRLGSRFGQWADVGTAASLLMGLLGGTQAKPEQAMALRELAWGLAERRGDAEAMALFHERLGAVLAAQGKFPEAESEYRIALDLRERALGPEHLSVASSRNNVAVALGRQGKYAEAEPELRQAVELRERVLGPQHPLVPKARGNLASNLMMQGKYDAALEQHRLTLEALEYEFGPDSDVVLTVRENMGHVLDNLDRYEEAEKLYRQVLEARTRTMEPGHPKIAYVHLSMAVSFVARKDFEKALPEARQAAKLMEQALGSEHPHVGVAIEQLADVLRELGEQDEALVHAERAWAIQKRDEVSPRLQASSAFTLGRLRWTAGRDRKQARELVERSRRLYEEIGEPYTEELATVRRWLKAHP
jgi:tetratricopeptide (TPR) repeat protein